MGKKDTSDLVRFLRPYPAKVQELALWVRDFVWNLYPDCNELIYDNCNAVAFGCSPTEKLGHTFCSVATSYIKQLLQEAYANSMAKVNDETRIVKGKTIVKSFSALKKRSGMLPAKKQVSKKIKSRL